MKIRLTAVIIEDGKILLLDQNVNKHRSWSLPGGKLEENETIEEGLVRELLEETGLIITVGKLLYVCDHSHNNEYVLHMMLEAKRVGGKLGTTIEGLDVNTIRGMEFVPIEQITTKGFSAKFQNLVENNFPGAGSYMGPKSAIGL
ncbi:MAG TPA: NUDIX hydrolase [Candidatus Saccharibacteria bacterium]|nr:NUDIX hydrolase [Candidatus Saccharibacteria bacterium]